MGIYDFLVQAYNTFLGLFPASLQWIVTLAIIVGLAGLFFGLIRHNVLFLIVLVILLPFIAPILQHLFGDVYHFFLYLIQQLGNSAPH